MLSSGSVGAARVKRILHFSDVHLNISASFDDKESAAFPYQYGYDAPIALLESALEYAKLVLPNPDMLLYTGDHAAHGDFSDQYVHNAVETNVKTFEKYYPVDSKKHLEATAIIGNADGNPDYHMEVTDPEKAPNPSIKMVSSVWNSSLSAWDFDAFVRRGYLTYELDANLTVITLNTVPYSPSHVPDTSANPDPFHQFEWLNTTLLALRKASKFAYIAGHIAPFVDSYGGKPQWHPHYIRKYKAIVSSYKDVVKAQFYGHVHSVEFRVPVDGSDSDALDQVPLFVSGSLSPLFGNNPSFMVWEYDADTYEVLDYTVHGTNLTADQKLAWKPLFQASEAYHLQSLASKDLEDMYERMQADPSLLEAYYWNMKAQSYRLPPCTNVECRAKTLCTLKWWTTGDEYLACVNGAKTTYSVMIRTGSSGGVPLPPSHVFLVIVGTVVGSTVVIVIVLAIIAVLKKSGVIKTTEQREKEFENVFPML